MKRIPVFKEIKRACLIAGALIAGAGMPSCKSGSPSPEKQASAGGAWAAAPYLSTDHQGVPVLSWTERTEDGQYLMKYARFDPQKGIFGPGIPVGPSLGTRVNPENPNKLAFKADGSMVALFSLRFEDEHNPFAGAIRFSISRDGLDWSAPGYLHSDTLHHYGRGFFDLCTLPCGEIGAIWLDGRFGEADTGSALFFSRTEKGGGFLPDRLIAKSTCECCRTDMLCDEAGNIHIAYRDISYPAGHLGKQVRDMAYILSADSGKSFSPPLRISRDNWEIEGCPHSGPSLTLNDEGLHAVWFSAGGGPGVYYAVSKDYFAAGKHPAQGERPASLTAAGRGRAGEAGFSPRILLDPAARHPQALAIPSGLAVVWEESPAPGSPPSGEETEAGDDHSGHALHSQSSGKQDGSHHAGHGAMQSAGNENGRSGSRIVLQLESKKGGRRRIPLTEGSYNAHHAVLALAGGEQLIVAWVREEAERSAVCYRVLDLKEQ